VVGIRGRHAGAANRVGLVMAGTMSDQMAPGLISSEVKIRHWSRVTTAVDTDGSSWFLKQFIAADGERLESLFDAELASAELLLGEQFETLRPIQPAAAFAEKLVIVYPFVDGLVRLDDVARSADADVRNDLAKRLEGLVRDLARVGELAKDMPVRSSPEAEGPITGGWKGLDIKNLACAPDGGLTVFDIGPIYRAPSSDPIGRLFASTLVSNWGHPLRRCLSGPPEWVRDVCAPLLSSTTVGSVHRRLEQLLNQRLEDPKQPGLLNTAFARRATKLLAPRYWQQSRDVAQALLPEFLSGTKERSWTSSARSPK
jgi:hypothetical protein